MSAERPLAYEQAGSFEIYSHTSPARIYPEETHETVQVCIPLEGASYRVTRESDTGTNIVQDLEAEDVLVVPAGQVHAVEWLVPADIVMLHLTEDFVGRAIDAARFTLPDAFTMRNAFVSAAGAEIRRVLRAEGKVSPALGEAMATVVAHSLVAPRARLHVASLEASGALSARQLRRLERYVNERLDQPIFLADLARELSLSKWHFMKCFKTSTGISPHRFITERRLARARALLASTATSITQIALDVGMTHSHFSRTFSSRFGMSPYQYRKLRRR
jgi:AraC family transcriptional regulator